MIVINIVAAVFIALASIFTTNRIDHRHDFCKKYPKTCENVNQHGSIYDQKK